MGEGNTDGPEAQRTVTAPQGESIRGAADRPLRAGGERSDLGRRVVPDRLRRGGRVDAAHIDGLRHRRRHVSACCLAHPAPAGVSWGCVRRTRALLRSAEPRDGARGGPPPGCAAGRTLGAGARDRRRDGLQRGAPRADHRPRGPRGDGGHRSRDRKPRAAGIEGNAREGGGRRRARRLRAGTRVANIRRSCAPT